MPPNPDPDHWELIEAKVIEGSSGKMTVLMVRYPGCTNYEGKKVLVYPGHFDLRGVTRLDPHFSDESDVSPIARFTPDVWGWENAQAFAKMMTSRYDRGSRKP